MLYVILSIAGIVSIATVILTFFVCLACYQNKQISKRAKLMKEAAKVTPSCGNKKVNLCGHKLCLNYAHHASLSLA